MIPQWHPDPRQHFYGFHFNVCYNLGWQGWDLRMTKTEPGAGDKYYEAKLEWVPRGEYETIRPTITFADNQHESPMQALFNALWAAGFRPDRKELCQDAVLDAKDQNLNDLRSIIDKMFDG